MTERCWEERLSEMIDEGDMEFCAYGAETCPDTGTLHYQAYCCFANARHENAIRKIFAGCHVEAMHGSLKQNETYCSKEGSFTKLGVEPSQGERSDLLKVKRKLDQGERTMRIAKEAEFFPIVARYSRFFKEYSNYVRLETAMEIGYIRKEIHIFIGPPDAGKSSTVRAIHGSANVYSMPDCKFQWAGSYDGQSVVLFDDVACGNIMPITDFLRYTDGYPIEAPVKGGFVPWTPTHIYFSANHDIDTWWPCASPEHLAAARRRVTETRIFSI
jgi:hypothetical protein